MNCWFAYATRAIVTMTVLLTAQTAFPDTSLAQIDQTRQTFDNIRVRRATRSLERQQGQTVPDQQRRQIRQLRRDLVPDNGLNSNRQQTSRQLDRLERDLVQPSDGSTVRPPLVPSKPATLPSSIDPQPFLPSFGRPLRTAIAMIDRAETALAEGRMHQARSDLATAGRELASASADTEEEAAAIEVAAERLVLIQAQLAPN